MWSVRFGESGDFSRDRELPRVEKAITEISTSEPMEWRSFQLQRAATARLKF